MIHSIIQPTVQFMTAETELEFRTHVAEKKERTDGQSVWQDLPLF